VLLSLLPIAWGAGWIYALCALAGGGYFIRRAYLLVREPTPSNAIRSFLASLLQLGLLLAGTIIEGAVRAAWSTSESCAAGSTPVARWGPAWRSWPRGSRVRRWHRAWTTARRSASARPRSVARSAATR